MKSKDIVFKEIVAKLHHILPDLEPSEVTYDSLLCLLGASSIDRAELIESMIEDLALDADRFEFHSAGNLGELAELFVKRIQEKETDNVL
jgi:polyketide biosynthesis acyl carrier protein